MHDPSKGQDEPRAIACSFPFLLLWGQSLPGEARMKMKGDTLVLGCYEPQAHLPVPPCGGGQISCDLASESGVQVLRKGNLDVTEQNSSTDAVQTHHVSPISASMGTPNCDGKAVCCITHAVCTIINRKKNLYGVFIEESI